jgi:hypothetical protein
MGRASILWQSLVPHEQRIVDGNSPRKSVFKASKRGRRKRDSGRRTTMDGYDRIEPSVDGGTGQFWVVIYFGGTFEIASAPAKTTLTAIGLRQQRPDSARMTASCLLRLELAADCRWE